MLGEYRTNTAGVFLCRGASMSSPRFALNLLRHRILAVSVAAALFLLSFLLTASRASADAGIVLNESLDTSMARITGSGHSAIYLSRICPDNSPTKMRLCRPGEQGSVLSNYTTLGEDQPYEWNIVPLSVYLYGVEDPRNRPLSPATFGRRWGSPPRQRHAPPNRRRRAVLPPTRREVWPASARAECRE